MKEPSPGQPVRAGFEEQRREIRIDNLGMIHGHVTSLGTPMTVIEIGVGGCSIQTTYSLPEGAVHDFRFSFEDGAEITVQAEVMHSRREFAEGTLLHISGLRFVTDESGRNSGTDLVDKLTSLAISFDVD